ncbi:hypothetical protein [Spiroplasma tabanidicola]|uniref:Uncharacterized protein n=1 Tax=Spiroplasma tabanidicola TaxID=324079 RepID=A0A6I6CC27_9MOLU|nr:hypothetical protein [Spiroplasma tabanidicola]QGS51798.1 hypothetical protein STABA_v1c04350 [Spiroplasma tabanidicola]
MNYKASDAIDLIYRLIGNISAVSFPHFLDNHGKKRSLANDIKEFYRDMYKRKIKLKGEVENHFDLNNWSFSQNKDDILKVKNYFFGNFFIKTDYNYYLNKQHINEELNKFHDKALDNTFISNLTKIDWSRTTRIIEASFLTWINNKNLKQDDELKHRLTLILTSLNEKEEINYNQKYKIFLETIDKYKDFVNMYDKEELLKTPINSDSYEKYNQILKIYEYIENGMSIEEYLDSENIIMQIKKLPDNAELWEYDFTKVLLKRVFLITLINSVFKTHASSAPIAKIEMIISNGGFKIDFQKIPLNNLYIALTQNEENVKKLIKISGQKLNRDLIDLVKGLFKNLLINMQLNQYHSFDNKEIFYVPNKKVIYSYLKEIGNLIKYHESNLNEPILSHPGDNLSDFKIAISSSLLNFEDKNAIIDVLRKNYKEIKDYPNAVLLKTIEYIESLSNVENI